MLASEESMAQDIAVPGLLRGVSISTDTSSSSVSRVASLVVTHSRIPRSEDLGHDAATFPKPVNLGQAASTLGDPKAGGAAFELDASSDSPE
uniref:Uncharacterized protein n=1 Tax=Peronospora matthiolae TaxID=2874970 RepID=A0AAV1TU68_9STRA